MENKKYILIENKGEMDVNALILMGGSTKRDSNTAIGMFGSGNKYSIALLLNKGIGFKIFSGLNEVQITTKNVEFRDKSFKQILINGQETSLTTDMGPQWDSWMALREFVSNSIDEGGENIINSIEEINTKEGYTRIYIEHSPEVVEVIENWDRYFSFDRDDTLLEHEGIKVYPNTDRVKESLLLYRKGIQCYHMTAQKALYSYDHPAFKINESRVLSDSYQGKSIITGFLAENATKEIATNILNNAFKQGEYWESQMYWHHRVLGNNWRLAIGTKVIINRDCTGFYLDVMDKHPFILVSSDMAKSIKNSFSDVEVYGIGQDDGTEINWRIVERTPKMEYLLKKANEFLTECKYEVGYPIELCEFDKSETLGLAVNKTILLSKKLFDLGSKEIVMTIIEENEHLVTDFKDESRQFQNHLFHKWISCMEEKSGLFL